MKHITLITALLLTLTSSVAMAADRCESWGCISTIKELYTNADGAIYIGTPHDEKLANCEPVSGVFFTLDPNAGNAQAIYSSLLAAYMSGKKIQLRVKEGTKGCYLAYVQLDTTF